MMNNILNSSVVLVTGISARLIIWYVIKLSFVSLAFNFKMSREHEAQFHNHTNTIDLQH